MRQDTRTSARERGYDAAWQRVRKAKLRADPLCEDCLNLTRVVSATMVHHLVPIAEAPELRLVFENLRSLCEGCHDLAHSGEAKQVKGCDEEGMPTHPGHPWAK